MIRIVRDRAKIPPRFRGAQRAALAELLCPIDGVRPPFEDKEWKKAKTALKNESFKKCAYCEADTAVVAHGDVEHFRPKSTYWWLAYCYDNYFYSCQICNQSYKGDAFPVLGSTLAEPPPPHLRDTLCLCWPNAESEAEAAAAWIVWAAEGALLVHPCFEDPEAVFTWVVDDVNKEVLAAARESKYKQHEEAAVKHLGLNREELKRLRHEVYEELSGQIELYKTLIASEGTPPRAVKLCLDLIAIYTRPKHRFAGMCRHFVRQAGLAHVIKE